MTVEQIRAANNRIKARLREIKKEEAVLLTEREELYTEWVKLTHLCPEHDWRPREMFYSECTICGDTDA